MLTAWREVGHEKMKTKENSQLSLSQEYTGTRIPQEWIGNTNTLGETNAAWRWEHVSKKRGHKISQKPQVSSRRADHDGGYVGARGPQGHGYYDYRQQKFIMEDGRWARVKWWEMMVTCFPEESLSELIKTGGREEGGYKENPNEYLFLVFMKIHINICRSYFSCFYWNVPLSHQLPVLGGAWSVIILMLIKWALGEECSAGTKPSPSSLMSDGAMPAAAVWCKVIKSWATRKDIAAKVALTCTETWRCPKLWQCWKYQKESSENYQTWSSGQHLRGETPSALDYLSRKMSPASALIRDIKRERHHPANLRMKNQKVCLLRKAFKLTSASKVLRSCSSQVFDKWQ